ncbi:MAG: hypothetical protein K5739_06810 [Lachnospiraceae bacterium]|nr:hypothetical protein [Lachnospiraceae bacterium]
MVVQHNLTAMNSNRMLGITTGTQAKSTEKLSSGYKINRAADNAAGLSISEKMRKQIRGLTQASANAQDGISAVQTAEGALNEVHDMLQRMNELAVQSANGTNSETDRQSIQDEINQLTTEIDRVSVTTKFNETYLLQGDSKGKTSAAGEYTAVGTYKANVAKGAELQAGTVKLGSVTAELNSSKTNATGALDADSLNGDLLNALNDSTDGTVAVTWDKDAEIFKIGGNGSYTANDLKKMGLSMTVTDADQAASVTVQKKLDKVDATSVQKAISVSGDATAAQLKDLKVGSEVNATVKVSNGVATIGAYENTYVPDPLKLDLHVGADSSADNKISVEIGSMSSSGLGLLDSDGKLHVDGADSKNADAAIDTIAAALQKVSDQRSALGAIQNRLEHTIKNLDNVVENTTAAESQIRDTDMATEMVRYSNNNILAQAGQSMLAQANQSNQGVLSLLG